DLAGRQVGVASDHRHHPPLGDPERETLRVHPEDRVADAVGQHRQAIRQEVLEIQLDVARASGQPGAGVVAGVGGIAVAWDVQVAPRLAYGFMWNYNPAMRPLAAVCSIQAFRSHTPRRPVRAQPHLGLQVTTFENAMGINWFEFVEVAAPAGQGARMREYLEKLGFTAVARHRDRAITLFRQGTINFLLNEAPDSFASDFAAKHGP